MCSFHPPAPPVMKPQSLRAALESPASLDPNAWAAQARQHGTATPLTVNTNDHIVADSVCWLKGALHKGSAKPLPSLQNASFCSNVSDEPLWHKSPSRDGSFHQQAPPKSPFHTHARMSPTNKARAIAGLQEGLPPLQPVDSPHNFPRQRPRCPSEFESECSEDEACLVEDLEEL
eukprot:GGOE01037221.1.p1 GENE.GGOE01037221.1~~GGOE01037221.1.p1  ORF type:complete len:175 (-),score=20.81 GGOE01037221.1:243-767(-)